MRGGACWRSSTKRWVGPKPRSHPLRCCYQILREQSEGCVLTSFKRDLNILQANAMPFVSRGPIRRPSLG
jgi:hypothetical protein